VHSIALKAVLIESGDLQVEAMNLKSVDEKKLGPDNNSFALHAAGKTVRA